jgi:hypothetical protein
MAVSSGASDRFARIDGRTLSAFGRSPIDCLQVEDPFLRKWRDPGEIQASQEVWAQQTGAVASRGSSAAETVPLWCADRAVVLAEAICTRGIALGANDSSVVGDRGTGEAPQVEGARRSKSVAAAGVSPPRSALGMEYRF